RQIITHDQHKLLTEIQKETANPQDQPQMLPFALEQDFVHADDETAQRGSRKRNAQAVIENVVQRKEIRGASGPLVARRIINLAANQLADEFHIIEPFGIEPEQPFERVRLRDAKNQQ